MDPPKKKKLVCMETVNEEEEEMFLYSAPWTASGRSQEEAITLDEAEDEGDIHPWMAFAALLSLFFSTAALNYAYVDRESDFFLYPNAQVEVVEETSASASASGHAEEDVDEEAALVPYLGMAMLAKLLIPEDTHPDTSEPSPFFIHGDMFADQAPSGGASTSSGGSTGILKPAARFVGDLLHRKGPAFPGAATDDEAEAAGASPFFIYGDAFGDLAPTGSNALEATDSQPAVRFVADLFNRTGPAFPGAADEDEDDDLATSSFNEASLNDALRNIFSLPVTAIKFLFAPFKPHREAPLTKLHKKHKSSEHLSSEDLASIAGKKIWGPRTNRSVRLRNAL